MTRRGRDWDNLAKLFTDALNGVAYEDDRQIIDANVHVRRPDKLVLGTRAPANARPATHSPGMAPPTSRARRQSSTSSKNTFQDKEKPMKKTLRSNYVVQSLIDDEDMSADLASLYPAASKIGDAAASFIDKADATIEKKDLYGTPAAVISECIGICQNVVKEGAAISRLLRNPLHCRKELDDNKLAESEKAEAEQAELEETQED